MRNTILFLTLVGLLGACGAEAPTIDVTKGGRPEKATVVDIGKLIPQDALAVIYAPSLDELMGKVRGVLASIDPDMANTMKTDEIKKQLGGPLANFWDGSRPFAVGVALSPEGEPVPTMIMPITDVAKAKEVQGGPPRVFSGNYMSMVLGNAAPSEPSATTHRLLKDAIANDLTLRIDVAGLLARFSDEIDSGLAEMAKGADQMGGAGDMIKGLAENVLTFAKSAEIADIGITMTGSDVDLRFALSMKAGSEFDKPMPKSAGNAANYAKMLPPNMPIQGVMHIETSLLAKVMDWAVDMMKQSAPEGVDVANLTSYMEEMKSLVKLIGPNYAMGMGFEDGLSVVSVSDASDPETYFAKMQTALDKGLTEGMGVSYEKMPSTQSGSVDIHTYRMKMDMTKLAANSPGASPDQMNAMMGTMFGKDGMVMHMAGVNNKIVMAMGSMDKMKQAIQFAQSGAGTVSSGITKAIKYAGGSPTFAFDIDLRAIMKQMMPAMGEAMGAEMPPVQDGKPARILIYGGRDGRVYRGGLSVNVGDIVDMFKGMQPK